MDELLNNWLAWLKLRVQLDRTGDFYTKQAMRGISEYWIKRTLLAENAIKLRKDQLTTEYLDAIDMLDHHIDNQGLNPTDKMRLFFLNNVANKT